MSVETAAYRFSQTQFDLLKTLAAKPGRAISLGRLARLARVPVAQIPRALDEMERDGYVLERGDGDKAALVSEPDWFFPERILRGLPTAKLGRHLQAFKTIGSTNDRALLLGEKGALDGTLLVTERQTKGRGRQGRGWAASEGKGLAFSLILRGNLSHAQAGGLTLAAAVALCLALEEWKVKPRIKWPNDVYLGKRKVCGILTESRVKQDKMAFAVIGMGVNLNQEPADFPKEIRSIATSYRRHKGRPLDRLAFFHRLLHHLERCLGFVRGGQFPRILAEWRKRSYLQGRQVRILQADRVLYGQVTGVDETGALLVRNDFGMIERILAGDVELLRLTGRRPRGHRLKIGGS
ncbi:MAG TPA: biotin--[acetyl-CoA-carboxylase] ligase [bacterium]|nr:biotin--[acetyl-CoA-carboxylase] ligase [bacterium]